jgi:elongation factor P
MIAATNLKNGATFLSNRAPYKVIKYNLIKMGRGGATVRVTAKNLLTGTVEEKTFSSNVKVDEVATQKKKLQYLYQDGVNAIFADSTTFEQTEIPTSVIKEELPFIKEGDSIDILFWDDEGMQKPLSVDIPPKVVLEVMETSPGVKGNSASNVYKDAVLENGIKLKVPLFITSGDKIRMDTRTGEYVERAKK